MSNKNPSSYEHNLERLFKSVAGQPDAGGNPAVVGAVLAEVRRVRAERRRPRWRTRALRWTAGLATAAVALVIIHAWRLHGAESGAAGQVKAVYGLVAMSDQPEAPGQAPGAVMAPGQWQRMQAGTRLQTGWGSQAEVLLADRSRLVSGAKTTLELAHGRQGETVRLQAGWVSVQAAKQARGKTLQVETPGARISVLGTRFDVHVVQKANGRRQTRVSVAEGQVALESAGQKILLPPNTEGLAEEGQAPERRCLTPEVNELLRLLALNERLARERGLPAGAPSLIEFNADHSATVWLLASQPATARGAAGPVGFALKTPVAGAEAYTLEGTPLALHLTENGSLMSLAGSSAAKRTDERVIFKLSGVTGLFSAQGAGAFECRRESASTPVLSLYQFWLPESARLDEITPRPFETAHSLSRQTVTLAVQAPPPDLLR